MKIIFVTLAIYVHACAVLGASTTKEYPARHSTRGIEDIVEEKCLNNSRSKFAYQNLIGAVHDYNKCANAAINHGPPHPVEQHDEFCKFFKENGFYSCMKNFADSALPCLDKSEKFFPQMVLKAYNTTLDTFCGTNGLSKTEYIFNKLENNKKCMRDAFSTIIGQGTCIENLNAYRNIMVLQVVDLNQQDYCTDMESFVNCAADLLKEKCNDSFNILKYHISDIFLSVCKKPRMQITRAFLRF